MITGCPHCNQKLRIPDSRGRLELKCPKCRGEFIFNPQQGLLKKSVRKDSFTETKKRRSNWKTIGAFSVFLLVLFGYFYINYKTKESNTTPRKSKIAKWITIDYAELLDEDSVIRTGQSLKSALADTQLRGAVQPFVDKFSYLLQYAIEMTGGLEEFPFQGITDFYPVGSKQPAWVALFRGGRISVTSDKGL
jgi:phage FluMu protein Com